MYAIISPLGDKTGDDPSSKIFFASLPSALAIQTRLNRVPPPLQSPSHTLYAIFPVSGLRVDVGVGKIGVGVQVGGIGVGVEGIGVAVGVNVAVGGTRVDVGGTGVDVGGNGVDAVTISRTIVCCTAGSVALD
jgi:hypothetical protein